MTRCFLFVFLLITTFPVNAQTQQSTETARVNDIIVQWFDGIAELDIPKVKFHSAKDLMILEDGAVWNLDSLANAITRSKNAKVHRTNRFNFLLTEIKDNTAWVAYNNTADLVIDGQKRSVNWLESAVLTREGEAWKVKLLHSTVLRPKTK